MRPPRPSGRASCTATAVHGKPVTCIRSRSSQIPADYTRLYRTGDFARVHKGTLVFEGRTDSQVKVRGHRVDLSELEAALTRVEGVDKGVVLCYRPGEEDQVRSRSNHVH